MAGGGLLEGLEESGGLAEGIVGAEIGLDLGEEYVHCSIGLSKSS